MRVFAIGDLHLEGGSGKTMDRFGEHWRHHDAKIFDAWERLGEGDDLLILAGDLSWAARLEQAAYDLERIGRMKGRKVMVKGNHDYWWETRAKLRRALPPSVEPLHASSIIIGRVAIAGTRGWLCPGDTFFQPHDAKIYSREVERLRIALKSLENHRGEYDSLVVALHYPPTNDKKEPSGFTELIEGRGADACVYGHLHGEATKNGIAGPHGGTAYYLVSADNVDFAPVEIELKLPGR